MKAFLLFVGLWIDHWNNWLSLAKPSDNYMAYHWITTKTVNILFDYNFHLLNGAIIMVCWESIQLALSYIMQAGACDAFHAMNMCQTWYYTSTSLILSGYILKWLGLTLAHVMMIIAKWTTSNDVHQVASLLIVDYHRS